MYLKNQIINPNDENEILTEYFVKTTNVLAKITKFTNTSYKEISDFIEVKEDYYLEKTSKSTYHHKYENKNYLTKEFSYLNSVNILSFNYTNVFDFLKVEYPCLYNNVHGKLCNATCFQDCNNSNIIFGIDDSIIQSQSAIKELRLFSKTFRKMQNTTAPTNILPIIENNQSLEIKFYGHSLSSADYSYFQSIFDYYNIYDNTMVSLIFYYSKGYEQYDAIYDLINIYGNTLANKDQGKNLMHKLLLENRLKIAEIE